MRNSTDLDDPAALEEFAPGGVGTCGNTPIVISRHGSASNDATSEDPAISADDAEPWARHALAANGFGGLPTAGTAPSARSTGCQLPEAAGAHSSFTLGEIIMAAIDAVAAVARRAHSRHQQRRQARAIYDALRHLDDRTLRDLGLHRSEITSIAAEVTGAAESTRVRTLLTSHGLPR